MHQLKRRVALAMSLPLAVAAPLVLLASPAHASPTPTVTHVTTVSPTVYGQETIATATVKDFQMVDPISAGTVQFSVKHSNVSEESVDVGSPVALSAAGVATSPPLTWSGLPLGVTQGSDSWDVIATFFPADPMTYDTSFGLVQHHVNKAGSSVDVLPTATTLVADLSGALPGGVQLNSAKPGGSVVFKVNGATINEASVVNGRATLPYTLAAGPQTVTAEYSGDSNYTQSAETSSRKDPLISGKVISTFPKSKSGWYRTSVDIWFVCKPQGAELTADCPEDTTLGKSGKGQSVTRTITAIDGGSATVTISGIDIDRDKPVITVSGDSCTATDKLSGVKGKCHLKVGKNGAYRAIAIDKAGNRAVKRGRL